MGLVADDQPAGTGEVDVREGARRLTGTRGDAGVKLDPVLAEGGADEGRVDAEQVGDTEQRPGRGPQRLRVERADAALEEERAGCAERLRGAEDRAGVPGVL